MIREYDVISVFTGYLYRIRLTETEVEQRRRWAHLVDVHRNLPHSLLYYYLPVATRKRG